jgi:selenocysteine lyase/cysteine desulfurase
MPLTCQRHLFDIPDDITYLNCAYFGPLSRPVVEAARTALAHRAQPWRISTEDFFEPVERARQLFASLVGGDAEGVSLVPSVSYGIALAAKNLQLRKGQEIVVLAEQFPSNVYAWRDLAERTDGRLRTVARPDQGDWTASLLAAIGEQTAIVAVPHCHWTDGGLIDLVRVGERARQVGAALVVDGCQSVGALPIRVDEVQPDFLVTASYKWLLGPYTHGFVWTAPKHRQGRPLELNWIIRANRRDFAALVGYTDELAPGARRFDMGEVSNFALLPVAIAALEQTLAWGVEEIQTYLRRLTDLIADGGQRIGLEVAPREMRAGHLIGLRLGGRDPQEVAAALSDAKIHVSVRGDSVRAAPHVYNDEGDVARLFEVFTKTV